MAYLTVNADDFGMTDGVTKGIHESIMNGVVTSTSAMVCPDTAREHLQNYASITRGDIGAHLQLTEGVPVSNPEKIPSLVDDDGRFFRKSIELPWTVNSDEIFLEWFAQIERLRAWGIDPAYLDSHHHVHLQSHIIPVIARLANELDLPVRSGPKVKGDQLRFLGSSCPDSTIMNFYGDNLSWELLESLLKDELKEHGNESVIELCCHPGRSCSELIDLSAYTSQREKELRLLCSDEVEENITRMGFELIPMSEVKNLRPMKVV